MTDNWNAVVKDEDTVFHLGDFSLNEKMVATILPLLKGKKILIHGNHDATHPCKKKRSKAAIERYLSYGFAEVHTQIELDGFILNHLPYSGDSKDYVERFPEFRPKDNGGWLLHGHCHEKWKIRGRQINVGVDRWNFTPVSFDMLKQIRDETII